MTKKELEQLIDLKKEIEEIEQNIKKIELMDIGVIPIKVDTSSQSFPYVKSKATVQSYDPRLADKRDKLLCIKRTLLNERRENAAKEEERLIRYINSIKESRVRRIMQFRYVECFTWERIGEIMHCDRTTAEKIISRYLKKNNDSE